MTRTRFFLASTLAMSLWGAAAHAAPTWSQPQIQAWQDKQGWMVGANFVPSTAINQLEMWQADTFDPKTIDKELSMAKKLGMNTARVFLHDLAYEQDPAGFKARVDTFLGIAAKHGIKPMLVIFDSVWNPEVKVGKQPAPVPGVHNSGWVQSPGGAALADAAQYPRLEAYVKDIVGTFGKDARVASWDLWNEPDNTNGSSYGAKEPKDKLLYVEKLLPQVFAWARSVSPKQPLTSGLWQGDWSDRGKLTPIQRVQLDESDFVSFHNYDDPAKFKERVAQLGKLSARPKQLTEYMARGMNSTFAGMLPILKEAHIAGYNWGFVQGKAQTEMPWDSWQKPYVDGEPKLWFHEIFRSDGKPYLKDEVKLFKRITGVSAARRADPGKGALRISVRGPAKLRNASVGAKTVRAVAR